MKTLTRLLMSFILFFTFQTFTICQIITKDTTLYGAHTFNQLVGIYDSTVTLTIIRGHITFMQGIDIEYGQLKVLSGSKLYFLNGYGLTMSRNANLIALEKSEFRGSDSPVSISLWKSSAVIDDCDFSNIKISVMETWGDSITQGPSFLFWNSSMRHIPIDDPQPLIFSQGVHISVSNSLFSRFDAIGTIGQYPNIHMQSNKYSSIRGCLLYDGGISAGSILNSNIEIINNLIKRTDVAISFWGVNKIEYNTIDDVDIGIEGGTLSNPLENLSIFDNEILNVYERAIDVVGHNIIISENTITGSGETTRGIKFKGSDSKIIYNLLRNFKIDDSFYEIDGVALYIKNAGPGVEVRSNLFEGCGLGSSANPEKVCSIVYLESPVTFISNELRLNTMGGHASPTNSFAGGPVLDIVTPNTGEMIIKNNLIHRNYFIGTGVYQPTNTIGTLVAIDFDRRIEFSENYIYGDNDATLGVALFPHFPDGNVEDSLLFRDNTIMNNLVGVGTMEAPVLGEKNIFKGNTNYHIIRYGGYINSVLYALANNWDSSDSTIIDLQLFDDEEGYNTGQIDFGSYYNISYDVSVNYTAPILFNPGDSLEFSIEVTNPSNSPVANMPVFFSSNYPEAACFKLNAASTGNDGRVSTKLYAKGGGITFIKVFAGDKITDSIEVKSGSTSSIKEDNENNQIEDFRLEQNYPNPFNPATKIIYSIPKQTHVSIKVFDVLGREVTTLVNEETSVGNYEVEFDANNLTSGIYFYRIQAGDFVDTKKMVLMK